DGCRVLHHFRHRDEAEVGHSETVQCRASAGHIDRLEPRFLGKACRHGAERAGGKQCAAASKQFSKTRCDSWHRPQICAIAGRAASRTAQSTFASWRMDRGPTRPYTAATMSDKSKLGLVIGGGNGIGAACCNALAREGWRVA